MPAKDNHIENVHCPCGIISPVKINVAQCGMEVTEFTCECGQKYDIIDNFNGCVSILVSLKE